MCPGEHSFSEGQSSPFETPWFPDANYSSDFSQALPYLQAHFIHEMTHALQTQQGNENLGDFFTNFISYSGVYKESYEYDYTNLGQPLHVFNFEQQAHIVEDYFGGQIPDEYMDEAQRTISGFQTQPPYVESAEWLGKLY